jgi:hypothetical protein
VKDISGHKEYTMKNILAITILMFGLAGVAMAQDYQSGPDAPLKADTLSTDNNKEQNSQEQKEAPQKPDCKADQQSGSIQQAPRPDSNKAKPTQAPGPAPQNVIEYGG